MKQIKIVQFGFEISGDHAMGGGELDFYSTPWALGEDGKLYAYDGTKWEKQFDCIELPDEPEWQGAG